MIIFDFDGVIVNTFDLLRDLTRRFDGVDVAVDEYKSFFDGHLFEHPRRAEFKSFDDPVLKKKFYDGYRAELPMHNLVSGIDHVISGLAAQHSLHIVTSGDEKSISLYLAQQNLLPHFKSVLGWQTSESKVEKFRLLGVDTKTAHEHFFVTDTLGDLLQAAQIGLPSIGVSWGFHDEVRLARGNPLAVVHTPEQLIATLARHYANSS